MPNAATAMHFSLTFSCHLASSGRVDLSLTLSLSRSRFICSSLAPGLHHGWRHAWSHDHYHHSDIRFIFPFLVKRPVYFANGWK